MKTKIIYEDKDLLVVYKPAGLPCQSGRITTVDMVSELVSYLKGKEVFLVHRLDQPVEGLLVVAKNKKTAAYFSKLVSAEGKADTFQKSYVAVAVCSESIHSVKEDHLVDYLKKDGKNNCAVVTGKSDPQAKKAGLWYECLGKRKVQDLEPDFEDDEGRIIGKFRIHLETGRFHQIRVQMSHTGMPLLGDQKYGTEESISLSRALKVQNVALCADRLSFVHPEKKEKINFTIEPENTVFTYF